MGIEADYPATPVEGDNMVSGGHDVWSGESLGQWRRLGLLGLAAFAMVTCFVGLSSGPDLGDHECINALAARQSLESGNWVIPYVGEIPRIRKPPLGIWLIAAVSYVVDGAAAATPVTEYSARLPSAIAAWGTVLLVYWLGRRMYCYRVGLTAGFIAASCAGIVFFAHSAQVDMVLTFLTTLCFACFWCGMVDTRPSRIAKVAFYVVFALAMLAKAPLPLVTVGLSLAVYWLVAIPIIEAISRERLGKGTVLGGLRNSAFAQLRKVSELWFFPGVILFVVLAGLWPVYVFFNVDHALALWRIEYFDRFTGEMSPHSEPLFYYIPILFGLAAPFLLSLPEAVAAPFLQRYRAHRKGLAFAFSWAMVGTCFLSVSAFKRPHYVLSVLPAYCLLLGPVIDRLFFGKHAVVRRSVQITCRLLPVFMLVAAVAGGVALNREYPALLRSYAPGVALAILAWTAACHSFRSDRRIVSFAELNVGVLLLLVAIWPGIRDGVKMNAESDALAQLLRAHGVQPEDMILWVDGRPDASLEFYSGYRVRRLIDEMEMTSLRATRRALSEELYEECGRRIRERLDSPQPVYLILSAKYVDMLERNTDIGYRELTRLTGFHEDVKEDLMVVTNVGLGDSQYDGERRVAVGEQ